MSEAGVERGAGFLAATLKWLEMPRARRLSDDVGIGKTRVFRFGDRWDPYALDSPLRIHGSVEDKSHVANLMGTPFWVEERAEMHASGLTRNSPFVSTYADPLQAVNSEDPILEGIAKTAPDLAVFDVPANQLWLPQRYAMSRRETEQLFLEDGQKLGAHLVKWMENPYRVDDADLPPHLVHYVPDQYRR